MYDEKIKVFLDSKVLIYNKLDFIPTDPISIPHLFQKKQDIEIAGLFAAIFSWGSRPTIIAKSRLLMQLMDMHPHDFILNHQPHDLKKMLVFKHRTFNSTDLLYFIHFLKKQYQKYDTLEYLFCTDKKTSYVENGLNNFHESFIQDPYFPNRTKKHISAPKNKSSCKRLNMFLRWMIRKDTKGVDFGIWKKIKPADLICPLDVHVIRVALKLGLISRSKSDWKTAVELTEKLKSLDSKDPIKYDFALFGLGVFEKF